MKSHSSRINLNLLLIAILFGAGCQTSKRVKAEDATHIFIFMETHSGLGEMARKVDIDGPNGGTMYIGASPVLNDVHIEEASAHDTADGSVAIQLQLNRQGKRILENMSGAYRGKRLAVSASFPELRWLCCVRMDKLMSDGHLTFFPNASPEECDRIAKGMNLVIAELNSKHRYK